MQPRPEWDEYFMAVAHVVKQRSNCLTRQIGAVIVQGRQIISTGYNGTPRGIKNCSEGGCVRCAGRTEATSGQDLDKCACCHAEENAIIQSALHGSRTNGATIYTTLIPCTLCAKMIINAGIIRVVAVSDYPDDLGTQLMKEAGIDLVRLDSR